MGTIRLLLALAVVLSHSYGYLLVGGRLAVQLFYIISGYLISYILIEAKSYHSIKKFYLNRFLRLFPAYYFISFFTLIFFTIKGLYSDVPFFDTFKEIDAIGKIYLIFSNFFIIGQDMAFFMGVRDGIIQFLTDYENSEIIIYQGHISHVSWTLSLEIMFYLIAPFILKNKRIIVYILISSIILRFFLIIDGIGFTGGFNYRFFPLELGLFLLGALSHQIIKPFLKKYLHNGFDQISEYVTYLIIIYIIFFSFIPGIVLNTFFMITLMIISLPLIFNFQNNHSWDAWVGKFSYPIYICHWMVLAIAEEIFYVDGMIKLGFVLLSTLVLAICTEYLINKPIEKLRSKNKAKNYLENL